MKAFEDKDFATAARRYNNALKLCSRSLGDRDINALWLKINLADTFTEKNERDNATMLYLQVLETLKDLLAAESRDTVDMDEMDDISHQVLIGRQDHAQCWYREGILDKAVQTLRQTLKDSKQMLPRDFTLISGIEKDLQVVGNALAQKRNRKNQNMWGGIRISQIMRQ